MTNYPEDVMRQAQDEIAHLRSQVAEQEATIRRLQDRASKDAETFGERVRAEREACEPSFCAEPVAYMVHDTMMPRMPGSAVGHGEAPTKWFYPAAREQHAKEFAKMTRGECTPLYAKTTGD